MILIELKDILNIIVAYNRNGHVSILMIGSIVKVKDGLNNVVKKVKINRIYS